MKPPIPSVKNAQDLEVWWRTTIGIPESDLPKIVALKAVMQQFCPQESECYEAAVEFYCSTR
jgi:hypothetical protein